MEHFLLFPPIRLRFLFYRASLRGCVLNRGISNRIMHKQLCYKTARWTLHGCCRNRAWQTPNCSICVQCFAERSPGRLLWLQDEPRHQYKMGCDDCQVGRTRSLHVISSAVRSWHPSGRSACPGGEGGGGDFCLISGLCLHFPTSA